MPETMSTPPTNLTIRRAGLAIAVALAVGVAAWLLLRGDDDGETTREAAPAVAASVTELQREARRSAVPIFWAGARAGNTYELTKLDDGSVFVRYLPSGTEVGDPRPNFLTVATYPLPNGYARIQAEARQPGRRTRRLDNQGLALASQSRPSSVYIAYPGGKYQVEVFDPRPGAAMNLAVSEQIRPLD